MTTTQAQPVIAPTQAQNLKAAAQQALNVLRGCLEHPDADDAISALEHAIAQPAKPYDTRQFSNLTNQAHGFDLSAHKATQPAKPKETP